jgi:23S rRNA (cytosine1962-C5)-methyltransferase
VARRERQDGKVVLTTLTGRPAPLEVLIEETGGMRLLAELGVGQKTGLFFDHRDNRAYVRSIAAGRRVLNLFSYTGGFSVAAALGGATAVTSVDIAAPAIEACRRNFSENGLSGVPHEALAEDVFSYLERIRGRSSFDLVISDPPSFAKSRAQQKAAEKAYRRLMSLALGVVVPGGYFCAASCTSQISPEAFRRAIADSARKARVRLSIVRDVGHAADHPIAVGHEEGRYLKFVVGRVLPRA